MAKRGPQGGPSPEARIAKQELRKRAIELRMAGYSNLEVAEILGVEPPTASRYFTQAIRDIPQEAAENYRQKQLLQLDELLKAIWVGSREGTKDSLWMIDRALAIMERQAKLLGLEKLAEIEAMKAAQGDAGVEAESMVSTLLAGFQHIYEQQKARESDDADLDADESDEEDDE